MPLGYTGFGMKKENYTRRPRKAFENYKALTEVKTIRNGSRLDRDSYGIYSGNWQTGDRAYRIVKITLLLGVSIVLLYVLAIDPMIQRIRKRNFEKSYFPQLYKLNRQSFTSVLEFTQFSKRAHIFKLRDSGHLFAVIKSDDFVYKGAYQGGDNVVNLGGSWDKVYQDFRIENETLFVDRVDKRYYVLNAWAIIYNGSDGDAERFDKVLSLISLNSETLANYQEDLQKIRVTEFYKDEKNIVHLSLKNTGFGNYEIISSSDPVSFKQGTNNGVIVPGSLYWIEKK